jgi:LPS-assembly lipoprotein
MYKFLISILLTVLVYGCGFHLTDERVFSTELNNTHIQSASFSKDLVRLLENNLRSNKISVVDADSATALLRILSEETQRVVLTVDSDGKAREFELLLRITFDVKRPDNTNLLDQQVINLNRDFIFDKSALLGAKEEERVLFNEMRGDAAKVIVYRLQTI